MHDIVIVPTYDRPEYLSLCLEKLFQARGIENKDIWVCKDNHADVGQNAEIVFQISQVVREAQEVCPARSMHFMHRAYHSTYGNSLNVLEAFRSAYEHDARYVFLVEDDVLVLPDYFEWHEAVQERWHPFVSCAGRVNRSLNFAMNGPEVIDESCRDSNACVASANAYGSWAACFKRENLSFVGLWSDHYNMFCPGNEQDICIQSLMHQQKGFSVWPYVSRAFHMGWYSYHRTAGQKFNGTLEEKIAALSAAISDPVKIRAMACLQEIDPYPAAYKTFGLVCPYLKADYRKKG